MTDLIQIRTIKQAEKIVGGFSSPSKMPGYCLSLSAKRCNVGSKLRGVKGSVCSDCYACKGRYVFDTTVNAQERRYNQLGHPQWVEAIVFVINKRAAKCPEFRWHDSGDVQSLSHLEAIAEVAAATPTVKHWLPTREYKVVQAFLAKHGAFPANLCVRISAAMKGRKAPNLGLPTSTVDCAGGFDCPVKSGTETCDKNSSGKACRACWDNGAPVVNYRSH